jgi:hypothetical protein
LPVVRIGNVAEASLVTPDKDFPVKDVGGSSVVGSVLVLIVGAFTVSVTVSVGTFAAAGSFTATVGSFTATVEVRIGVVGVAAL